MKLTDVSLSDIYDLNKKRVFLTGSQAVVRLTLMQHARDQAAGFNTAGYVTGYRGSPVGGLDQQFERAEKVLKSAHITFSPGINEDLAATAIWGAQQAEMRGEGAYDGVFSIWYGKGPGVDRSGDAFRHANAAGTSPKGGVLVMMGDDHAAESSTVPHQSEFALMDAMMPILNPAGVQEVLDYGIYGWALSRFCGCWVGIKCVHDNIESTAIVEAAPERVKIVEPKDFKMPEGGLHIRPHDDRLQQERRLHSFKRFAAVAFVRANKLDKIVLSGGKQAKIGIVTTGKSYLDVRQSLDDLGIDEVAATKFGLRLLKVAMVWPLDPEIITKFANGLDQIIVVEEKRALIETQIREQLYNNKSRPLVIGKKDEDGVPLFKAAGVLQPNQIAIALATRLLRRKKNKILSEKLAAIKTMEAAIRNQSDIATRVPYFCSGCPHNSSTVLPEGGRGYAGIGCHWMVQFIPERNTEGNTQMGGEGVNWVGEAPFSTRSHIFQNLGDGTYNHSGLLAIRAAIAAKTNITYKILYNDAVAMTGGQAHDSVLSVSMIAQQVRADGVERIAVVSDEPDKYTAQDVFPARTSIHHRDDLQSVQQEMMQISGTSVLIYDQTCAAEKRRRRKRGTFPDPARRIFINEQICEGCGDCGVQSNCVAIAPVETPFGRKRQIDQSACNKDFSCLKGFCPSFVTIEGGTLKKGLEHSGVDFKTPFPVMPEPELRALDTPWAMMITGIGGTGVVTIGRVLGMAAHMEGKGAGLIDMAGLAQKNGAVVTHLKLANRAQDIASLRIAAGGADLILGCDLVTSAAEHILAGASRNRTHAVVNDFQVMPAQFTRNPDFKLPASDMQFQIEARVKPGAAAFYDSTRLATAFLGDAIASNMFTLGIAYQLGLVPLAGATINQAIALNGVAVEMNQQAFLWGRRVAHDKAAVEAIVAKTKPPIKNNPETLDDMIEQRVEVLTAYQNAAYGAHYRDIIAKLKKAEDGVKKGGQDLTKAGARYLFKLMAYKDEYEVARLMGDADFARAIGAKFKGDFKLHYHLAPPILAKLDAATGSARKMEFGPWMAQVMAVLAKFKFLRGTVLDVFGYTQERRQERALIDDYEAVLKELCEGLTPAKLSLAAQIASVPEHIRGFGHVKQRHIREAKMREAEMLAAYRSGKTRAPIRQAAE